MSEDFGHPAVQVLLLFKLDLVYTMPVRNKSGMKLFLFSNLLFRLHDAGTKSTLFEWVNQNESRNEWMNQNKIQMNESNLSRDASGMKSNRIRVFTVFKSIQLAYRIFISYRIQIISMPVSCRRKANPVFVHTVFISYPASCERGLKLFPKSAAIFFS